jgi:hypothetical protein
VSAEDICVRIEAVNRGPEPAMLHVIPHLWFRNTWSWAEAPSSEPSIHKESAAQDSVCLVAEDANASHLTNLPIEYHLGKRYLYGQSGAEASGYMECPTIVCSLRTPFTGRS